MSKTLFEKIISDRSDDEYLPTLKGAMEHSEIIDIKNVVEYFNSCGKEKWNIQQDFPNIAPPFQNIFFELGRGGNNSQSGCLFMAVDEDNPEYKDSPYKWEYIILLMGSDQEKTYFSRFVTKIFVDENGCPSGQGFKNLFDDGQDKIPGWVDFCFQTSSASIFPCLLALSFMHCKNVTIEEHKPSVPGKRNRHGPHITFKTLDIKPMQKVLREEGNAETTGLKMALHICRGHFKTFSGKGLFGKYTGTYWWDSQVRGKAENGIVIKDYKVDPE